MIQQPLLSVTNGSPKIHRTVLLPRVETFALEVREDTRPITSWEPNWNGANGLPADARVSLGISAEFTRQKSWPLLAHLAQHAKLPPGIGTVTNLSGNTFADGGFDTGEQDSSARLVFIIDKSGSMWGGQLEMAKNALLKSLNSMDGAGKFYVYFFNHFAWVLRQQQGENGFACVYDCLQRYSSRYCYPLCSVVRRSFHNLWLR